MKKVVREIIEMREKEEVAPEDQVFIGRYLLL